MLGASLDAPNLPRTEPHPIRIQYYSIGIQASPVAWLKQLARLWEATIALGRP